MEQFFRFVRGRTKWFAFCQVIFGLSLCHSDEDVRPTAGDLNLELRRGRGVGMQVKSECCERIWVDANSRLEKEEMDRGSVRNTARRHGSRQGRL